MLRIAALWWCGPGKEDLEYPYLENGPCISARTLNLPQSAATIQDAVAFPQCLSSGAQERKIRGRCLAPQTISHRCDGSSATSEASRKSLRLNCVTECRIQQLCTSMKTPAAVHIMCNAHDYCANHEEKRAGKRTSASLLRVSHIR